jgi:hypothetical protein
MKHALTLTLALSLGVAALLAPGLSRAEEPAAQQKSEKRAQMASFFDAGAQAYDAGQYVVAAEAFLKAHALLPSPALLFSAAQSYRRQYLGAPSLDTLRQAISLYREYLRADPNAPRREDANIALEALVPIEARLASDTTQPKADPSAAPAGGTRLLLSARPDGAQVSLDGGPFVPAPVVLPTKDGPHVVRVRADGHHDEEVAVQAVENELIPSHVVLRPKPAKLDLRGTAGARIAVDGQPRATLPLEAPLLVEPGAHTVTVTARGHRPWLESLELRPDASATLRANLVQTPQRLAAWTVLGASVAGAIVSGTLTGLTLARQSEALAIRDRLATGQLTPAERDRYNAAVQTRNDLGLAAGITAGATLLALAAGTGLYVLDEPEALSHGERPRRNEPRPRVELSVGVLSGGLRLSF